MENTLELHEPARFRVVIHDLKENKSKAISLRDGKNTLQQVYDKLIEFFKLQNSR